MTKKEDKKNLYSKIYTQYKVAINGVKVSYVKAGKGPILVFVHGWANNWVSWVPLANCLYKDYTVYLLDLPGFGDSDDLPYYSIELVSKYLEEFVKKLPDKPQAVIGLSMGSMVVAESCKNNNKISETIILMGPVIKNSNLDDLIAVTLESSLKLIGRFRLSEMFLKKIIETRIAAYSLSRYINMYKFNKFLVDEYGMIGKKKMRQQAFVQMGYSGAIYDLGKTLTFYKMPVLLIYGREDKISSPQAATELLKPNNYISIQSVPFAGHVVPLEQPEKVAAIIKNYLEVRRSKLKGKLNKHR